MVINLVEEIVKIIKEKNKEEIIVKLENYHDNDIADSLKYLTKEERLRLYDALGYSRVSDIFAYVDDATEYFEEISIEKAVTIVDAMDSDDAVDVLESMDENISNKIVNLMDKECSKDVKLIQSFDDEEIGSKMTTNYISIQKGLTIRQAMKELIAQAEDNDNIDTIYVCNEDKTLYGALNLKDLIVARHNIELESLIVTGYPFVYANDLITECLEKIKSYSENSIPVVNKEQKLIGVITSQDIIEVVGDEMEDDYAKLAGLHETEELDEPLSTSIKKRFPWLILLLFLGMGVSTVVGIFESVVKEIAIIVCFQSLILGMAGNAGTQSLAVTIRMLMDENTQGQQKIKLLLKEIKIGIVNGLLLGLSSLLFVGLYIWAFKGYDLTFGFAVAGCVGIALFVAIIISSFVGTVVPIFFKNINIDPAVASGPLITTVNDLVAVISYYGIVWLLLINLFGI